MSFALVSPVVEEGQFLPTRHTCDGAGVSPPLEWSTAPRGTQSFALWMEDLDAGGFTHWLLFDIAPASHRLEEGSTRVGVSGRTDDQRDGYSGPCPPPRAGDHRYRFTLLALDVATLGLASGARRDEAERRSEGHVLESAVLTVRYRRGSP